MSLFCECTWLDRVDACRVLSRLREKAAGISGGVTLTEKTRRITAMPHADYKDHTFLMNNIENNPVLSTMNRIERRLF